MCIARVSQRGFPENCVQSLAANRVEPSIVTKQLVSYVCATGSAKWILADYLNNSENVPSHGVWPQIIFLSFSMDSKYMPFISSALVKIYYQLVGLLPE